MPQINDLEHKKFEQYSDYAVRIVDTVHVRIHEGKSFIAGGIFNGIANNASIEFLVQVVNVMHAIADISVSGDCEIHMFENPTWSDVGISAPSFNKNRNSLVVTGATLTHSPTITDDGTEFPPNFIPGGSGGNALGGQGKGFESEMLFKPGNSYLLRVTNVSGVAATICPKIEWYEPAATVPP